MAGTAVLEGVRVVWVTRSLLDYRIPVFEDLDRLLQGRLHVLCSDRLTPSRVQEKLRACLGDRSVVLRGERSLGLDYHTVANASVTIPYQPGLLSAIGSARPDVLVGDGFFQWTFAPLLHRVRRGTPLVVCYERTPHTDRNAQWYRVAYRKLALRYVDAMCCSGRLSGERAQRLGMPADRITYGHMAADTKGLAAAVREMTSERIQEFKASLGLEGTVLLYVGRLLRMKGLRELLQAWSDSRASEHATLLLVGDGEELGWIRGFCREKRLENVRLAGAVAYDRIAEHYAAADALVMPTLEDNWSLVVPEAMACGLPVLCSRYNGCWPELVTERNGWVFDPLDPADVRRALERCLEKTTDLGGLGAASRAIVAAHSPERAAEAVLAACRIALRRKAGSRAPLPPGRP